jgi:hypothetical protein
VLAAALMMLSGCRSSPQENSPANKAAIIDQLFLLEPNPSFIDSATVILESSGYNVDLWQGDEITVDFYRKLPEMGYKLIIFRAHAGVLKNLSEGDAKAPGTTYLFTAEEYSTVKYLKDQLTDKVSSALMSDKLPLVFAVNPAFFKDAAGRFDNTVMILMGCETAYLEDMPQALVEKGASAYVGWSAVVTLEYVDKATLDLLGNLCTSDLPLAEGIGRTMAAQGKDPYFDAYLNYYPPLSANQTIRALTKSLRNENK